MNLFKIELNKERSEVKGSKTNEITSSSEEWDSAGEGEKNPTSGPEQEGSESLKGNRKTPWRASKASKRKIVSSGTGTGVIPKKMSTTQPGTSVEEQRLDKVQLAFNVINDSVNKIGDDNIKRSILKALKIIQEKERTNSITEIENTEPMVIERVNRLAKEDIEAIAEIVTQKMSEKRTTTTILDADIDMSKEEMMKMIKSQKEEGDIMRREIERLSRTIEEREIAERFCPMPPPTNMYQLRPSNAMNRFTPIASIDQARPPNEMNRYISQQKQQFQSKQRSQWQMKKKSLPRKPSVRTQEEMEIEDEEPTTVSMADMVMARKKAGEEDQQDLQTTQKPPRRPRGPQVGNIYGPTIAQAIRMTKNSLVTRHLEYEASDAWKDMLPCEINNDIRARLMRHQCRLDIRFSASPEQIEKNRFTWKFPADQLHQYNRAIELFKKDDFHNAIKVREQREVGPKRYIMILQSNDFEPYMGTINDDQRNEAKKERLRMRLIESQKANQEDLRKEDEFKIDSIYKIKNRRTDKYMFRVNVEMNIENFRYFANMKAMNWLNSKVPATTQLNYSQCNNCLTPGHIKKKCDWGQRCFLCAEKHEAKICPLLEGEELNSKTIEKLRKENKLICAVCQDAKRIGNHCGNSINECPTLQIFAGKRYSELKNRFHQF